MKLDTFILVASIGIILTVLAVNRDLSKKLDKLEKLQYEISIDHLKVLENIHDDCTNHNEESEEENGGQLEIQTVL